MIVGGGALHATTDVEYVTRNYYDTCMAKERELWPIDATNNILQESECNRLPS